MKFVKSLLVSAALAASAGAASAQTFIALSSPGFTTETTSLGDNYLKPIPPFGTVTSYSVLSSNAGFASSAVVTFAAPTTSFTFLWGSPDSFNSVTDNSLVAKSVTGSSFSSGLGNNAESTLYTFTDVAGFTSLTFKTTGVAFELAVAAVPEPETYALMLAGLGAMAFVARRRKNV